MPKRSVIIGMYEYSVLLAIKALDDDAYGAEINRFLVKKLGRKRITAQIYMALIRLKDRGLVSTTKTKPLPIKGGRSRTLYTVKPKGIKTIQEINSYFEELKKGWL